MYQGIRPLVTTGVALVGASVIAVSTVTVPPPEIQVAPLPAAERFVEMSDVQLASLIGDLTNVVNAIVQAPGESLSGTLALLNQLGPALENASSGEEVVGLLAFATLLGTNAVIGPYLQPLIVNVPQVLDQYDFGDAAALNLYGLASLPTSIVTLPAYFAYLVTVGQYSPAEAVGLIVSSYLTTPFEYAQPWFAALANVLPGPVGGTPNFDPDAPGQGLLFDGFHWAQDSYAGLLNAIFGSPQMIQAKEGVNAAPTFEETWPPSAEEVGQVLKGTAQLIADVPGNLANLAVSDVRQIGQYLAQGRPLDAVRLVVAHAIGVPLELAALPVELGAIFAPPPIGGLISTGFTRTVEVVGPIVHKITPKPPESIVEQKAIESFKDPGNVVNLSLSQKKIEDGGNLIVEGADQNNGSQVTKVNDNRPKVGSNARAVVKEVRQAVRQTVKDVRQGVRDVVKAVTGLGKKKDEAEKKESVSAAPSNP